VTAKTKLPFSLFKSLTARGLLCKSSSKRCIAGMIGTCRRSQFFVPLSGSPLTHIMPPSRSTSVHLTYPASASLQPENAKNSIKSPHCWEHHAPAERTAETKAVNSSRLGSSSCFARTQPDQAKKPAKQQRPGSNSVWSPASGQRGLGYSQGEESQHRQRTE
jgi:hypothetical protein